METNTKAFLKLITFLEANWKGVDPYYLYYGNKYKITTLKDHPIATGEAKYIPIGNNKTSASGAYQIVYKTYKSYKEKGFVNDFSKASQDKIAIDLLGRAINNIEQGHIEKAIEQVRNIWEAFDKILLGKYGKITIKTCIEKFKEFGGIPMIKQKDGSYQPDGDLTINSNSQQPKKKTL